MCRSNMALASLATAACAYERERKTRTPPKLDLLVPHEGNYDLDAAVIAAWSSSSFLLLALLDTGMTAGKGTTAPITSSAN